MFNRMKDCGGEKVGSIAAMNGLGTERFRL
jgi:hypothetical protein